ncbi:TIR domain-containing protein [Nannocystis pusilla]|uniref:Nucleotide-binding protein n=1 Tax=Nannocystis pusilla TaxID=889268 RepID=A0ABS7TN12_9BACT|nr:nucleotide-binding protein [Nannocystis pusilla]MBZ5709618.1 nucleotide-binding protein [Nannocystis pusilla]
MATISFPGTQQQLEQLVSSLGIDGDWTDSGSNRHFTSKPLGGIMCYSPSTNNIWFQGKAAGKAALEQALTAALRGPLPPVAGSPPPPLGSAGPAQPVANGTRIFVVHGHDEQARDQLELVLHKLGLEPFVLQNSGGGGLTIIEALEKEIATPNRTHFGIVLMTPDDMGYSAKDGASAAAPRARQNVVLEMGMMIAALTRSKVAILKKGHLETPSDAAGILYKGFNMHVKEVVPWLVDRLRHAGINVSADLVTRASA